MARSPAKPQKPANDAAPSWMNPASKQAFSALLATETGWKGFVTDTELQRFADLVDLRSRIVGMRKLMRSALRAKEVAVVMSLNAQINQTVDKAHRLEDALHVHDRQKTAAQRERAA